MVQKGFIFQWKETLLFYLPGKTEEIQRLFLKSVGRTESCEVIWASVLFSPFKKNAPRIRA